MKFNSKNIPNEALQALKIIEELFDKNQLIGVYLYGSAILGNLQINSDVDVLVIINHDLSDADRKELTKRLLLISGKIGCKTKMPLEVTVVNINNIVPWKYPPKCEFMYGEWLREQIESGVIPQTSYDPDVAILLWQARDHNLPLKGLEITKVIEPVPMRNVREAIKSSLPELITNIQGDERNVLLTLARMWFTASTGKICSKDFAAQ